MSILKEVLRVENNKFKYIYVYIFFKEKNSHSFFFIVVACVCQIVNIYLECVYLNNIATDTLNVLVTFTLKVQYFEALYIIFLKVILKCKYKTINIVAV